MTLDRDIRFSADEIIAMQYAVRGEIQKATRSITTAEANRAAGGTIQQGTLDSHYRRLIACRSVAEKLEAARRNLAQRATDAS